MTRLGWNDLSDQAHIMKVVVEEPGKVYGQSYCGKDIEVGLEGGAIKLIARIGADGLGLVEGREFCRICLVESDRTDFEAYLARGVGYQL